MLLLRSFVVGCCLFFLGTNAVSAQEDSTQWFSTNEYRIVRNIFVNGNKTTKQRIITRELTFNKGDTIWAKNYREELSQSRNTIYNTGLFHFVVIKKMNYDDANMEDPIYIDVLITVSERWYIWPFPTFEIAETNLNTWWLKRDFNRTNYGLYVDWQNFRGRKENLILNLQLGYTKQFALKYAVPYLNKKQNLGGSVTLIYNQNDEVILRTFENKREFFNNRTGNVREEFIAKAAVTLRKGLYFTHLLEGRFTTATVNDSIPILTPDYFANGVSKSKYLSLTYSLTHDRRDVRAYPLNGHYLKGIVVKSGFGLFPKAPDVLYSVMTAKVFRPVSHRVFLAGSISGKIDASKDLPYYHQEGLGYGYTVRGYEYYVVDGQSWALLRTNAKIAVLKPKVHNIKFIRSKKFNTFHTALYFNVFTDLGYVVDKRYASTNPLANEWISGAGIGLDFVTYYDKVMRMEYSFNALGEAGFFLHFTQPI